MLLFLLLAPVVAAGQPFTCTPTHVWDGDGPIWCAEGPRIRLAGIAAREIDESCRFGHPCPRAKGDAARDHLVRLLGGARGRNSTGHILVKAPSLRCRSEGSGTGSRTAAWCSTERGADLSCAMAKSGYALIWPRYSGSRVCRRN
jgi:endonuclease YncB( thermonuclease family)